MFCHNCGNQLPENAMFCTHCGARFSPAPEQEKPQAPAPRTITLPNFHMEKSILAVLILCAAILFTVLIIPACILNRGETQIVSYLYFLGDCDMPASIDNASSIEASLRFSAVFILVSLTAIVLCVLKRKNLFSVIAGLACLTVSLIDFFAYDSAFPAKSKWHLFPIGPAIVCSCAVPIVILLFLHYKRNKAAEDTKES